MTSPSPAPRSSSGGRRFAGLPALVLPLVIGMAACSRPAPTVTTSTAASSPAAGGQATDAASQGVTGASPAAPSAVSQSVTAALQALVSSSPQPSTAQIRETLSAAGFAPAAVEVSASRTPTGLAADAVEVGVLADSECVMAQLRAGTVATSVLPVLPSGRCFIGSVQR